MNDQPVKQGEKCPHCRRYYSRETVVDGIVVKDEKILLIKRGIEPSKGKWALPGGYISWGETLEEAVVREVKEESGIETAVAFFVGSYSSPNRRGVIGQNIAHVYALTPLSATTKAQESEIEEVRWFPLSELPEDLAFDHKDMIEEYMRTRRRQGFGEVRKEETNGK